MKRQFDYIVVGAGTAGCVLASRLSESGKHSVLLVEAGPLHHDVRIRMPSGYPAMQKTRFDWQYHSIPQQNLNGRSFYLPRGRLVGGTGAINGMIYIRGHPLDYDEWKASGNNGWGYEDVLPFFRQSENNTRFDNRYHGTGGPLEVASPKEIHPLNQAFVDAGIASGLVLNQDFNGASMHGVGFYQGNIKKGKRQSTAEAFLFPAMVRENLRVLDRAEVTRITFSGSKATGVELIHRMKQMSFRATLEVILCGGAINSPKLLLLSGIGDEQQLKSADIPVVMHAPHVGRHLQDHVQYFLAEKCTQRITLNSALGVSNLWKYFLRKRGIFSWLISGAGGFVDLSSADARPDIQFHFVPGIAGEDIHDIRNQPKYDGYMLGLTLLRPASRGWLQLKSNDHRLAPVIQMNFLSDPADTDALMQSWEIGKAIMDAAPFNDFRAGTTKPAEPVKSASDLRSFIENTVEGVYHTAGTCRMGKPGEGVVDHELKLHGVEGLRIADASVMPAIVSGNINAAVVMIAEKLAYLLEFDKK